MKAMHKGKIVEVWQVSKTGARPDWVVDAFTKNYMVWVDKRLRIRMAFIHPSGTYNFSTGLTNGAGGYVGGFGQMMMADEGDFIILQTGDIVSPKKFSKKYEIIEA